MYGVTYRSVRCIVGYCLAPLQSNIFSNDKDVHVMSVGTHNHNTTSYKKNDLKEITYRIEKKVHKINEDHSEHDFLHEMIIAKHYDCIDSERNRSSSDIETVNICRYDEMNDCDNVSLHSTNI